MNLLCGQCGTENRPSANYCKKCGIKLADNQLDNLSVVVGREEIKTCLNELIKSVTQLKKSWNNTSGFNMNMLLLGNTGTGKTFIPDQINRFLFQKNIVSKEHALKIDASEFNSFIENISENFRKAKGGILFIDNFHKLIPDKNNYESLSALDRLLFEIDKQGNDPIIILSGHTDILNEYFLAHAAFRNRFEYYFNLTDYTSSELYSICKNKINDFGLQLNEDSANKLLTLFKYAVKKKDHSFGNAHYALNEAEDALRNYYLRISQSSADEKILIPDDIKRNIPDVKSLNQVLAELDELIGLEKVKAVVREIASFIKLQKKKQKHNPKENLKFGMHLVLRGNPGTGKTTIARKLGEVFSAIDFLDRGHVVEVDKSELVGQYVGETPLKVQKKCNEAMGGILFIDEAYSLASETGSGNSFGQEAIDTLLKRMEDDREKFVVIAAGYRHEMERFLNSNTGLKSRFDRFIDIDDYKPAELYAIFKYMVDKNNYNISAGADEKLKVITEELYNKRDKNFANGREVRKLFEQTLINLSQRYTGQTSANQADPFTITEDDLPGEKSEEKNPEEIFSELNKLVGLNNIKHELYKLATFIQVDQKRKKLLGQSAAIDYHFVFMGNPGTGKTTVARFLGKIFKSLGLLSKGHLIEADRSDLVGSYVGHTSPKTNNLIDTALGGVLFIDEAYSLVVEDSKNDFGNQAIQILLKRMEDDRGKFITVVAGYPKEMKKFIESNPGLESRFKKKIIFEDYTPEELFLIFKKMFADKGMTLTPEAEIKATKIFEELYSKRDKNFGNGRTVRNYFDTVLENQSFRIAKFLDSHELDEKLLLTIEEEDLN